VTLPERYLLSPITLAVARVDGTGELSDDMKAWAARYKAFLVVPANHALTDADRETARAEAARVEQEAWVQEAVESARREGYAAGEARGRGSYKKPAAAPKAKPAASSAKDKATIEALKTEIKKLKNSQVKLDLVKVTAERDNYLLKLQVLQDVVGQCGGEGKPWDHEKLRELAEIVREVL
jgi:flagellar biosynthesis/type III secretory pathway protein FliH